jgi:large subunit ribosomal protein L10e
MEALCRACYKFPSRQKIIVSKKWGFTNVTKGDYLKLKEKKVLQCVSFLFPAVLMLTTTRRDGAYIQFIRPKGPLKQNLCNQPSPWTG